MKKRKFLMGLLLAGVVGCGGSNKRVNAAKNACYALPYKDLYQEAYGVISAKYPIARESEKRGFISTDWIDKTNWAGSTYGMKFEVEVLEGAGCNRVTVRSEIRNDPGGVSASDDVKEREGNLYVAINKRAEQTVRAGGVRSVGTPSEAGPSESAPGPAAVADR